MKFDKICMIGLGYIGLPTAAVLASRKVQIIGVDVNPNTVDIINRGEIHIVEPDLDILVSSTVSEGYLKATTTPVEADAFIMAVPTPFKGDDHAPNLDYIESATRALAKVLKKGNLVILESTSPVGTTEKMAGWLAEERPDLTFPQHAGDESDIRIAHCPERVLPGHVIRELVENDRIIGGMSTKCVEVATELYKIFVKGDCIPTNSRTAEMSKLTENASRDVSIAFANELSILCDKMDIDVWELISLANRHPRVNILQPGCGVGGHCIAVDPWFIVNAFPDDARLMRTAREINDGKPLFVVSKVKEAVKDIKNPKIACLGLAFKPNIDDLRESPALEITKMLSDSADFSILAVEPNIKRLPAVLANRKNIEFVSLSDALKSADVVVILVRHKEFITIDGESLTSVIDTTGIVG
ncbi:UDP-N-acetyl-D-mannosamine dehydrogenase [Sulfurovum sp. bin170]|uniref:UDP-N-acetyl-D-mannosamine dehydrogenase n=1 Tax=Sulfurovum sp. bin170 TaxID=2695268 RepID=UPI0013DED381|nr:UDP-N-acetyl-D-mannosamine dehydrogenase [Sulfurovum sp. bin170]NEW61033.1 UDP-N-acetyl-D-mannosamine dehydrogenase [Sulfurovum sp. bin170]